MLAQRKYDRRVASSCGVIRCEVAVAGRCDPLEAEQEVRRDQNRLDADRQSFFERALFLLCRSATSVMYFSSSRGVTGRRKARRARSVMIRGAQVADDGRRGGRRCRSSRGSRATAPSRTSTDHRFRPTLTRTPFSGIFASSACASSNRLRSCASRSGGTLGGGLNSRRRLGACGRVWSAEAHRQPFVDARDGDRHPVIARRQPDLHLDGLPAEVLPVVANDAAPS